MAEQEVKNPDETMEEAVEETMEAQAEETVAGNTEETKEAEATEDAKEGKGLFCQSSFGQRKCKISHVCSSRSNQSE